jgi:hypothetical protein
MFSRLAISDKDCLECNGTGHLNGGSCDLCHGTGKIDQEEHDDFYRKNRPSRHLKDESKASIYRI